MFVQDCALDEAEDVESMEFSEGIKMNKTTRKVQICSTVKINFLEYIDQGRIVKAQ